MYTVHVVSKSDLYAVMPWHLVAFERTHTIFVVFQARGFHDVPRVVIADARPFQALAAILDMVTRLASISCWYRSDARQDEFRLSQAALL